MPSTTPFIEDASSESAGDPISSGGMAARCLAGRGASGTDADTEERRSAQRYRRAAFTGFTSLLSKVVALATSLISVPLTLRYLGDERYGLWMTVTSFVLFLGFADFGVGNGIAAKIAEANGMDDIPEARRQVACGFFLLCFLALLILAFFAVCFPLIPWARLYSVHSPRAVQEAGPISAVLVICTALSMPLGTVLRVQIGYQEGYVGDLWNAAGNVLALIGILIATRWGKGLPILVLAVAGAPVLMTATNWLIQFLHLRPWLMPRLNLFDLEESLNLARVGALFFAQQCFGLIYYVSDNVVIARMSGAAQVAHYVVFQKIFSIGLIAQYLMVPLWPAIGEAMARQDWRWAHTIVRRAIMLSLALGVLCGLCLLFASRYLMKKWAGTDVGPPDFLRIGFAVWVVLVGYIAAMNAILNQPGIMGRHLVYFGTGALLSVVLKVVLIQRWSLAGVVWGTIIGYGVAYVIPATRLALASTEWKGREAQ